MSKISDLKAKGDTVVLSNGMEITFRPITIDVDAEIGELINANKTSKAMALLVKSSIKDAIPDATDEEINHINKEDLKKITETVMKINGMSEDKKNQ